ncbi:hypothetical protein F5Y12DRAFT_771052 [Xylaria sp. FL1777]|nr:hypothetical protein F5Y12DRAFT_771052 [Xylaria sp. FL1777]
MQFSTFILAAISMGSAIASPTTGFASFNNALAVAANVKVAVQQELAIIKTATSGARKEADAVVTLQKSLRTAGLSVNSLLGPVVALGNVQPTSLSKEQLVAVSQFQKDILDAFVSLQLIGKTITGSHLSKDALAQVKPELQWVLASPAPIARLVIAFVKDAAPKYASYGYWNPYLINIQALIVVALGPLDLDIGLDIEVL